MENQQRSWASRILSQAPRTWTPDDKSLEECRDLIQILAERNDQLFRECHADQEKLRHVRAMGSTLARLNQLINRLEKMHLLSETTDILVDSRGITYETVRACDLERICDK